MKKLITWTSLILAISLFAEPGENKGQLKRSMKVVPLSSTYLSIENGGTNHASAALSDGIGIYTTQEDEYARAISHLNGKYGDDALKDEKSLKEYVLDNGTVADKELANKLNLVAVQKSNRGDSCDDGNPQTENDIYLDENFTCQGVLTRSESKCLGDETGSEFLVNGVYHLVVDNNTIKNNLNRAETLCTSKVTNMSNLFKNNKTFNSDISKWDTSNVTNMSAMFESAISFNQPIGDWDTSKVTNMSDMFSNVAAAASAFNQDIGGWDTSNVTDMGFMFHRAEKFKEPLNNWNVSNVTRMYGMFYKAYGFNQALDKWNVKKVTDMRYMFQNATSFNQDLSGWCVSQVTTPNRNLFNSNTPSWDKPKPIWGSCPQTP